VTRSCSFALPPSWQAFLNKTIRENKSAAIMNMGKGVYGLKEWGRSGQSKELKQASPDDCPGPAARTASSSSSKSNAPGAGATSPRLSAMSVLDSEHGAIVRQFGVGRCGKFGPQMRWYM